MPIRSLDTFKNPGVRFEIARRYLTNRAGAAGLTQDQRNDFGEKLAQLKEAESAYKKSRTNANRAALTTKVNQAIDLAQADKVQCQTKGLLRRFDRLVFPAQQPSNTHPSDQVGVNAPPPLATPIDLNWSSPQQQQVVQPTFSPDHEPSVRLPGLVPAPMSQYPRTSAAQPPVVQAQEVVGNLSQEEIAYLKANQDIPIEGTPPPSNPDLR